MAGAAADNCRVPHPDMPALLFDFTDPTAVAPWSPIDGVTSWLDCRTTIRLRHDPAGHAVFEGEVSLARQGGFASVRSAPAARGRPGATACVIEVCTDGRRYKLNLLTDDGFDSLNHQTSFQPAPGRWQTLTLPLAMFRATFRGREVPGAPALAPARIRQVGLVIADRQAGRFSLSIRRLSLA